METNCVAVIGAGAAGLAAAHSLAKGGVEVCVIEARARLGGRIHTITSRPANLPIELGAEFVHGERNATWDVIGAAGLQTQEVPDRHWSCLNGELREDPNFWDKLEEVTEKFSTDGRDLGFKSFLERCQGLNSDAKRFALDYVEGFHAADARRIGIHALARAEQASARENGTHHFRIAEGYAALLRCFEEGLRARGVELHLETIVRTVRWTAGHVEIEAQSSAGWRRFEAERVLITLPLGVLQAKGPEAVWFEPALTAKENAIKQLAMGSVSKVILHFKRFFWPVQNFGFIHADDPAWPTWWSDERGPVLTSWTGGPRARRLLEKSNEELASLSVQTLSRLFKVRQKEIEDLLLGSYTHDWDQDRFSRGAYSYTPAGAGHLPAMLAEPIAGTLFFAGEATDSQGAQGTVHGALASGWRAAVEVLNSFKGPAQVKGHGKEHAGLH